MTKVTSAVCLGQIRFRSGWLCIVSRVVHTEVRQVAKDEIESEEIEVVDEMEDEEIDLIEDLEDDDLLDEEEIEEDLADDEIEQTDEDDDESMGATIVRRATDDEEDEDDLVAPDDVEEDLAEILQDRLATEEEPVEEEEAPDWDDRTAAEDALQPKRADEVLCTSCFLLVRKGAPTCPVGDDACPVFAK